MGRRKGLTGGALKGAAVLCMLLDHAGWAFVDTLSPAGFLLHLVGRVTAPVICFLLAEGYRHTHSFPRYLGRMAAFAALSYLPYLYFQTGRLPGWGNALTFNMLYTLTLCLLALRVDERCAGADKWVGLCLLLFLSFLGDWPGAAVLFALNFARNRGDFRRMAVFHGLITGLFTLLLGAQCWSAGFSLAETAGNLAFYPGTLLALPLIRAYNGQRGRVLGGKWFFYLFYPVHLAILGFLRWL